MHRIVLCVATALLTAGVATVSAAADDRETCWAWHKDKEAAIAACSRLIERNPKDSEVYVARGNVYRFADDIDRAIADYGEAIRLDPKAIGNYRTRGDAWLVKRDYDRAIADYGEAIRLDPKSEHAYASRGHTYYIKGEYDRAIADSNQVIRLKPEYHYGYFLRGTVYLGKGEFDHALADYEEALRHEPSPGFSYDGRGNVHSRKGEYDQALADYDKAISIYPNVGSFYTHRGKAYAGKGDHARAIADFDEALKLNQNDAEARQGRDRARAALASPPAAAKPVVLPSSQPTKRALVIGIDAYPHLARSAQLERAVADAEAVGDRLAGLGFQVTRLTAAPEGTLKGLLRGFEDFKKTVAPNDMVVLFYAGHGMGLPDGTYLLPADVDETSLEAESTARRAAINENELTDGLRQARAGIVVAVIDACRNDLFSRAVRRAVGNERGLRPVETEGIFKIYSASEGQTALDRLPSGDASKNSVFTRVFLKALATPGLNLSALGTTVRDEVHDIARSADHAQTPAVYDKLIGSTRVYIAAETATADGRRGR